MSKPIRIVLGSALIAIPIGLAQVGEGAAQSLPSFAVISGETLTNTGPTTIVGNIALSPGSNYTGSVQVTQTGAAYINDAVAARIKNDLAALYTTLAGLPASSDLSGQDLGGMTLSAGVYNFAQGAGLASGQILTLDGGGNPDAIFIFNIESTFTAESGSSVVLQNGAQGGNVYFRVGSSATLNTTSVLEGQIVALQSVSLLTGASITCGAAYARNGSVTLDTNTIGICGVAANGLTKAVAQTSGEVATGIAPMGMQSMNAFLDAVVRSGRQPRASAMAPRDEGVPIGLVRDKVNAPYIGKYGSAEPVANAQPFAYPAGLGEQSRARQVWASAYGSHTVTDGDTGAGAAGRTSENRGVAVGWNFSPSLGNDFGIAMSWNTADFRLAEGFGSGSADTMFVALRGRSATERAYLEGALAFGRSNIATERTVTIAGTDRLVGETKANSVAAHIEAGYHMGIFTPFIGLRAQSFKTNAYSETAASGSSVYALRYDATTTTSVRSELGVDLKWPTGQDGGAGTSFGLRAAWAHEFASNAPGTRSFVSVPGNVFAISGATQDRDSLVLAANVAITAVNGFYVDGAVNAEFSNNSQDYGGSITFGYSW